jgi:hypothetical protein
MNMKFWFGLIIGILLGIVLGSVLRVIDAVGDASALPSPIVTEDTDATVPEATVQVTEAATEYVVEAACSMSMKANSVWLRTYPDPMIYQARYMSTSQKFFATSAQIWFGQIWLYGSSLIDGQPEIGWTRFNEIDFELDEPCPALNVAQSELSFATATPVRETEEFPISSTCLADVNRSWPVPVYSGPGLIYPTVEEIPGNATVTVTGGMVVELYTFYRIRTGWIIGEQLDLRDCSVVTTRATPWPTATPYR